MVILREVQASTLCNPLYPILHILYEIVLSILSSTNLPHRLPDMVAQSYIPGTHTLGQEVDLVFKTPPPMRDILNCKWCLSKEGEIPESLLSKVNRGVSSLQYVKPLCRWLRFCFQSWTWRFGNFHLWKQNHQNCATKTENNLSVLKAWELRAGGGKDAIALLTRARDWTSCGHFGHRHTLMATYF